MTAFSKVFKDAVGKKETGNCKIIMDIKDKCPRYFPFWHIRVLMTIKNKIQWGFKNWTSPVLGWSILTRTGHPNIEHPRTGHICPDFESSTSLDRFINKKESQKIFYSCQNGLD
jgi:hypothetical protein